jgi:aminoglycoside phosphotransferase (APT) family kinase protein
MAGSDPIAVLQIDDPLYAFLREQVAVRVLGLALRSEPSFSVYSLDPGGRNHWVRRYLDRTNQIDLVCKFYGSKPLIYGGISDRVQRAELMRREFNNLERVRALGFAGPPHGFVRPLATCAEINCVLVEEYVPGRDLGDSLVAASRYGRSSELRERLEKLAAFLADLHGRTRTTEPLDGPWAAVQLSRLASLLTAAGTISAADQGRLNAIAERWTASNVLSTGHKVCVFGDIGPSHFIFREGLGEVTAIDFELLRAADPAEDIGRMIGELLQAFYSETGDFSTGAAYCEHFCSAYAGHFLRGIESIDQLMARSRFFTGFFLVCIGRHTGLDLEYRRRLIGEAMTSLTI